MNALIDRLNLRSKLILLFLLIGLLPLIITAIINSVIAGNLLRNSVIAEEQSHLNNVNTEITRFLDTTVSDILWLSESSSMQDLAAAIAQGNSLVLQKSRQVVETDFITFVKRRLIEESPVYLHVRFLNTQGFEFVRVDHTGERVVAAQGFNLNSRANRTYFQQAQTLEKGQIFVSPVELFEEFGRIQEPYKPVMRYSTPIFSNDELVGVLVTDVDASGFLSIVDRTISTATTSFLVDKNGYYLRHPDESKRYGADLKTEVTLFKDHPVMTEQLTLTDAGVVDVGDALASFQRVQPPGNPDFYWTLVSLRSTSSIMAFIWQQLFTILLSMVAVSAIVIAIALYFARNISVPIARLTRQALDISENNFEQQIDIQREDEIGKLAKVFNTMTRQIHDLISNLERRVQARTRDLQLAVDVSKEITTLLDTDELLQRVCVRTVNSFGLYFATIFLVEEDKLKQVAGANAKGEFVHYNSISEISLNAAPSLIARAARERKALVVNDTLAESDYLPVPELPDTRSEYCIPLIWAGKLLGVFDLQDYSPQRFTEDEQRILQSLAEQITIAVRNAQLFHDAQEARLKAESASSVKSQFLTHMSHELRTPLNGVINFTQMVASGALGAVNPQQVSVLRKSVINGEHLLSLINDILDISKIESGSLKLFVEDEVDVLAEVHTAVNTGEALLDQKPITLKVEAPDYVPCIRGDRRRIRQILLNLVSNACKYTNEGTITVRVQPQESQLEIRVIDTGVGIAPEDHDLIFKSFQQTDAGLRLGKGTGLGLPISRHLTEIHGGQLRVESEVGQGSEFILLLPIQSEKLKPTLGT